VLKHRKPSFDKLFRHPIYFDFTIDVILFSGKFLLELYNDQWRQQAQLLKADEDFKAVKHVVIDDVENVKMRRRLWVLDTQLIEHLILCGEKVEEVVVLKMDGDGKTLVEWGSKLVYGRLEISRLLRKRS